MNHAFNLATWIAVAIVATQSGRAIAAEADLGLRTGLSYSTNIERVRDGGSSEGVGLLGVDAKIDRAGSRSRLELAADLTYLSYLEGVFDDELLGRADAKADFFLVGERVRWVTAGSYGQMQVDPSTAFTPENREDVRYLATGPDFRMQLGRNAFALLTARYSTAQYEISELDGTRLSTTAEFGRELSSGSKISLNATRDSLEFDRSVDYPDYDRTNYFIAYQGEAKRTGVQLAAGYVTTNTPRDRQSNPLLRVGLSRDLTVSTSASIDLGTRLTDVTDSFSRLAPVGAPTGITTGTSPGSPATFRRDEFETRWRYLRARNDFTLAAYWYEDTFTQSSNFDVERWEIRAILRRKLTPMLTAELHASIDEGDYRNFPVIDRGWLVSTRFDYQLGRRLSLIGEVAVEERNASIVYSEQRMSISLRYAPFD